VYGGAQAESELDQAIWVLQQNPSLAVVIQLRRVATVRRHLLRAGRTAHASGARAPILSSTRSHALRRRKRARPFDQAFFGLIATGWDIDDFAKPGASRRMPFQAIGAEHVAGVFDREAAHCRRR